jgi:hypothetical protein
MHGAKVGGEKTFSIVNSLVHTGYPVLNVNFALFPRKVPDICCVIDWVDLKT